MIPPSAELIDRLLHEDVPYGDLTSHLLGIGPQPARMTFSTREPIVVAGVRFVRALCERVGAHIVTASEGGEMLTPGGVLLVAEGSAGALHQAWKVSANVFESCCGIATRTRSLVDAARGVSPGVGVFATRKSFPGTKDLAVESIVAGGALPHRLGLSETVLVFQQHTRFVGGLEGLAERLPELRRRACEKKVLVEVETLEEALLMASAGVDGLQFDKVAPADLVEMVAAVRRIDPGVRLIAAGGVNNRNAADYAATGVDALATSWMYGGRPADIKVRLDPA